ncbi:hypothetical protein [Flavobacterium faecale]|uniref:hypothetical protein n=1 Tax=Flavobacterium faecale TaxID=1355330 RepID=UPI00131EDFDE|nr:hypothetical protein [Flavobacterium faecale]
MKTYSPHRLFTSIITLLLFCTTATAAKLSLPIDSLATRTGTTTKSAAKATLFRRNPDTTANKPKLNAVVKQKVEIVTYKIYFNGKIIKVIPKKVKEEFKGKYRYVYIDKKGKKYELGDYKIYKIQKYRGEAGEIVNLVNLEEVPKSYKNGTFQYHFNMDSPRSYVNEQTLASFFGAMLEVNYLDIGCNGFSHKDGSSKPSRSHINGNNGDFKYLRADKTLECGVGTSLNINKAADSLDYRRQNKWNDALYKFGWKKMLGWTVTVNKKTKFLHHITHKTTNHHHHLHVQNYEPHFKEIKL